jgi:hypothetical protein
MPLRTKAQEAGIMQPAELDLLRRVFDRTAVPNESEREREARASRIIGYFTAGISDEEELCELARQPLGR